MVVTWWTVAFFYMGLVFEPAPIMHVLDSEQFDDNHIIHILFQQVLITT